jgi:SNF2 family DNA or RNA helicase
MIPPLIHQKTGSKFIGPRRRSLLLDRPGFGKSRTFIMALDMRHKKWGNGMRGVVTCPAIARDNWLREFQKWSHIPRRYLVADDLHDLISWERGRFDVLICSYEFAAKWAFRFDNLMAFMDFFCGDEFHRLKAEESKRKIALVGKDGESGLSAWAAWGVGLSGTIAPNDPIDLYNPLRWTGIIKSKRADFTKRYFITREGLRSSTNKPIKEMVPELRAMFDKVAIRRTEGLDLPPIWFSNLYIDGDQQEILNFLASQEGLSDEIYEAINEGNLALLDSPQVATVRRLIGEAKALPYARMLVDEMKNGDKDKVVGFGFHRAALHLINDHLNANGIPSAMLVGGMTRNASDGLIREFEEGNSMRVLVCNYKTAGEAITLTSSRYLDNFERPWGPGDGEQVVMRVWRLGQKRTVFARNITLRGSYDEDVNKINDRKNENMDALGLRMMSETGTEAGMERAA